MIGISSLLGVKEAHFGAIFLLCSIYKGCESVAYSKCDC